MTNSPTDLKPCPFCGQPVAMQSHGPEPENYIHRSAFWVQCDCLNQLPFETAEEAAAFWNTRPLEAENADLRRQLAQTWVPVEDDFEYTYGEADNSVTLYWHPDTETLETIVRWSDDGKSVQETSTFVDFGPGMFRLCRRQEPQSWVPVEDGETIELEDLPTESVQIVDGHIVATNFVGDEDDTIAWTAWLPDWLRLCRRQETPGA